VILNYSVFANFVYTSPLFSDVTAVYHRAIMIIMLGDYLIFQQKIVCTFLRRWGQIWTYYNAKAQLDNYLHCTLSLTLFCRFFFVGGGAVVCSAPDQTSRFMTAESGRFNRPLKCIYWGMRPLSACQLTGAPGEKKNLQPYVCWPSTGRCKKQLAGNHVRMVILLVPMFSATTFRLFVCLFLYYRHTRIVSFSSSPFEERI